MHFRHYCRLALTVACFWITVGYCQAANQTREKLYITNSDGDDITVVDVATNRVLRTIKVGPHPHGITTTALQDVLVISIEGSSPGQLVWIDPSSDKIIRRLNVGPRPNQLAITPDGAFIFVPVDDGTWEVVDNRTSTPTVIDKIFTGGRPHNTLCSADGKHMYLAPMAKSSQENPRAVSIVDVKSRKVIGKIGFSDAIRPIAVSRDDKRFYANIDNLIGMEVADIPSRKVIYRVAALLDEQQKKVRSRSHGIAIRPDGRELWTCDVDNHQVYVFDLTNGMPRQIATIAMGAQVYWLTFTPDGQICYVSVRGRDKVAAIDTSNKKIVARIATGEIPKRLIVISVAERLPKAGN